jgi:hypothetical protein
VLLSNRRIMTSAEGSKDHGTGMDHENCFSVIGKPFKATVY